MRWIVATFLFLTCMSCHDYHKDIDSAISELEWIDNNLNEIGERNFRGYSRFLFVPGYEEISTTDTIKMTVAEFNNIQRDIYEVQKGLEEIQRQMLKDTETNN